VPHEPTAGPDLDPVDGVAISFGKAGRGAVTKPAAVEEEDRGQYLLVRSGFDLGKILRKHILEA
jgi:hypothetical protein